jgi:hypothetical protein
MSTSRYVGSADDPIMAAAILDLIGEDGFYRFAATGETRALRIQWIADAGDIGDDLGDSERPWEAAVAAYVGMADVPDPHPGDYAWIDASALYAVEDFRPKGGLWLLGLVPAIY